MYVQSHTLLLADVFENFLNMCLKIYELDLLVFLLHRLLLGGFKWVEETSQFHEDFLKNSDDDSDEGYFTESDVQYPRKLQKLLNGLPFCLKA